MSEIGGKSERTKVGSVKVTSPSELIARDDLSSGEKVAILHQWEFDLREQMVAEEENMPPSGGSSVTLDEVLSALRSLGAKSRFRDVTTKHG